MEWIVVARVARAVAVALLTLAGSGPAGAQTTPVCGYEVVNAFPHDPAAFTQGLVIADGELYEGTGLRGASTLRRVDLETGSVEQSVSLDPAYFGEGVAAVGDRLIQLTWTSGVGFVYDRSSFARVDSFTYAGQGWGLTWDGAFLIQSDGSSTLELWDPSTFASVGTVSVFDHEGPVANLNELEWIEGEVFANIWTEDRIARIDPASGEVLWYVDLAGLRSLVGPGADVLNGIAYDPHTYRLFVTGKYWDRLFEIRLPDCRLPGIFGDGFESGDAARWTAPGARTTARPRQAGRRLE